MKTKKFFALGLILTMFIGSVVVVKAAELDSSDSSFTKGKTAAENRQSIYNELPENATDEQIEEFYNTHVIGEESAYVDGEYDETAKEAYGYNKGKIANAERQTQFTEEDGNENYSNEGYSYSKGAQSYAERHAVYEQ